MSQATYAFSSAGEADPDGETYDESPEAGRSRRRRFAMLTVWTIPWALYFGVHGGFSWHFFDQGSRLLFHGASAGQPAGGLHLYANYPQLQIGPVTFAIAELLRHVGKADGVV